METNFKAVKITGDVYWVGAIDWLIRDFHGYATNRGTTYNAYLVMAEKVTLIDTVKAPFRDEMMSRIASVIDPKKIKIIVSNHSEMDHSGSLPEVIDMIGPEKVYASVMGEKTLVDHFHEKIAGKVIPVKDGESISLGNMKLIFAETRMLHWPDSMISFLPERSLLFSQDAFGMHLASFERFDDQIDESILDYEAGKYYANIIMPYANLVTKLLERVPTTGWDIKVVAPDHGPIWRKKIPWILSRYTRWAGGAPENRAVVVYDTMWQSTARMARVIGEGLSAGGTKATIMPMAAHHRSDVITEILNAGALVVGSPTLNNNIFPTMADVLVYMKGLKPKNLIGAAFGSYGWSGEAVAQLNQYLTEMKVDLVDEGIKVKNVPTEQDLATCYSLGKKLSDILKGKTK
jgi:flavorubredoxin